MFLLSLSTLEQRCDSGITILEGLAASGLRSVRYALEIPGVRSITANDISADAYRMIQKNIQHNNVQHIVKPSKEDAGCVCLLLVLQENNECIIHNYRNIKDHRIELPLNLMSTSFKGGFIIYAIHTMPTLLYMYNLIFSFVLVHVCSLKCYVGSCYYQHCMV